MAEQFKSIVEKMGSISVRLQMAGSDMDGAAISNESILDLVEQVKTLKISAAYNAKFGPLYWFNFLEV